MLESQKLAIRASEIRTKSAALAGADGELSDEAKTEIGTLRTEYQDVEVRYQATATAEDVKKTETAETAEGAEYRALVDKAELGSIYAAALEHRNTDGAEDHADPYFKPRVRECGRPDCDRTFETTPRWRYFCCMHRKSQEIRDSSAMASA